MSHDHDIRIRSLQPSDLDFAQEVRKIAGWNQTDADWLRLINYEPDGCFLIECDGGPAGTATHNDIREQGGLDRDGSRAPGLSASGVSPHSCYNTASATSKRGSRASGSMPRLLVAKCIRNWDF